MVVAPLMRLIEGRTGCTAADAPPTAELGLRPQPLSLAGARIEGWLGRLG